MVIGFGILHIIGLFWILAFIFASLDFIICCATALWYHKTDKKDVHAIKKSVHYLFRYHIGSVAFGSFIIAIVWIIQFVFEIIARKLEATKESSNGFIKFLICCCRCCLDCFERFIRFITKNAYTLIAMTGKNFCSSAKDAFNLAMRNLSRYSVVAGIGEIFVSFGRICIALLTAVIGYLLITKIKSFSSKISSPVYPTIVIFLTSVLLL